MHPVWCRHGSLIVLLLWGWCHSVGAQTRVYIDINKVGGYLLPVAIPKLIGEDDDPMLGQELRSVLRQDLEITGLFRIVDPATYIDQVPQAPDSLQYENWSSVGAAAVIAGKMARVPGGDQVTLQLVLHDVAQQRPLDNRDYNGSLGRRREMAHRFSDHVFQAFTGVEGPFDTQVVCATPRRQGKDIVIMDYDGYNTRTLVSDGALNLAPVLSPDGALLAYTSYRAGAPNLYLRHLAGGQDEKLTSGTGLALAGSWSPDGRYLALNQTVEGNSDIFLYDLKQKRFTRLTTDWGIDVSPSFAPDGRRLVFTSDRGGSPQLYITDIHGGSEARLTYEGKYNTAPAWGPLDDTIAFVGRSERRELVVYTMHTNGQRLQRLTEGGSNSESPTWAPNGHFMMYISMEGNTWRRYIVREDGQGKAVPATVGPVCLAPQWVGRKGP